MRNSKPRKAPENGTDLRTNEEKNLYAQELNERERRKTSNESIWQKHLSDPDEELKNYCKLSYRNGAKKIFFLLTDEDSDLPVNIKYRFENQTQESLCEFGYDINEKCRFSGVSYEPNFESKHFAYTRCTYATDCSAANAGYSYQYVRTNKESLRMSPGYELELEYTAKVLMESNVDLFTFYSSRSGSIAFPGKPMHYNLDGTANLAEAIPALSLAMYQFGDAFLAGDRLLSEQTFTDINTFDYNVALQYLKNFKLSNSLQARIIAYGGKSRVFEIESIRYSSGGEYGWNGRYPYLMNQTQIENIFSGVVTSSSAPNKVCKWKSVSSYINGTTSVATQKNLAQTTT